VGVARSSVSADSKLSSVASPKQARSEETLSRLLDAAESLIVEKSISDVSIPEIVRRAGSSVGGFYARFRDKNELLRALEERFFNDVLERVNEIAEPERWRGVPVAEIVRPCVFEFVQMFREREALITAFLFRAAQDPDFIAEGLRFRQSVSEHISSLLLDRREEFDHPDPEVAIEIVVQMAIGLLQQMALSGDFHVDGRRLNDDRIVDEITRNFISYIGI
jgi:AcrR family transcriptional regulator